MSWQATVWVMEFSVSQYGSRLTLLSIANHCDARGENAFPSIPVIAWEARLKDRAVQRALPELVELGELFIVPGAGPAGSHLYSLPGMRGWLPPYPVQKPAASRGCHIDTPVSSATKPGVFCDSAIRKNSPKNSPNPERDASPGPAKYDVRMHLSAGKLALLGVWLREWQKGIGATVGGHETPTWREVLRIACAELLFPLDAVIHDLLVMDSELWSARLAPPPKKGDTEYDHGTGFYQEPALDDVPVSDASAGPGGAGH